MAEGLAATSMSDDVSHVAQLSESQSSDRSAYGQPDTNIQGILDFATEFVTGMPQEAVVDAQSEDLDNSGEELSPEDDAIIEADADNNEETQLSEEESGVDSVFTYEDLAGTPIQIKVGGEIRELTIDQIASELGQVPAASKAQSEIKSQRDELQALRSQLEYDRDLLSRQQDIAQDTNLLGVKAAEVQRYQEAYNHAAQKNDTNAMVQLRHQLDVKANEYAQTEQQIEQKQSQLRQQMVNEQASKLDEMGYGHLLTDNQRRETLASYVQTNLSPTAAQAVNYDASLLATVEKARLYDAAKARKSKPKPSGRKTLKAGSGNPTGNSKKPKTPEQSFKDIANRMLRLE